jgi:hypothetical protein
MLSIGAVALAVFVNALEPEYLRPWDIFRSSLCYRAAFVGSSRIT